MKIKITDWKDIAGGYYEKSMSLAILLLLFAFLVSPKLDVKPYERKEIVELEAEYIPPEDREIVKPPEQIAKPEIELELDFDDEDDEDDEDIVIIKTINKTTLEKVLVEAPSSGEDKTPDFVPYEVGPVPIKQVRAEYPSRFKKLGIQGSVFLKVEVLKSGKVREVKVLKSLQAGPGGLDEAAIKAVKQWEYQPAQNNGKPVAVWVKFPYVFKLDN